MAGYVVYFEGRNTPVAVEADNRSQAISKARKNKKRGGDKVMEARKATPAEIKTAAAGNWITTRPKHRKGTKSKGCFGKDKNC